MSRHVIDDAIAEIQRLRELNEELLAALKAVVAVLQKEAPGTALNHHQYDALGIQAHAAIRHADDQQG